MKTWRQVSKTFLRLGLCVLLLGWIFQAILYNEGRLFWKGPPAWEELSRLGRFKAAWTYGPPQLWEILCSMDPRALALSLVLMGMTVMLGVIRWQMVLRVQGLEFPLSRTTRISFIAHFFNSFLLGSTGGDLLKAYYVARETHHKKTEAVTTVLVDRILGMFSMLLLASIMMVPNHSLISSTPKVRLLAGITLCMTVGAAGFVAVAFWGGVSRTLPKARVWLRRLPKGDLLERALDSCRDFGRDRTFLLKAMGISMVSNVVCVLHFMCLTWGFHLHVSPLALGLIVPMVTSIASLPIAPPGGLGAREGLYVSMLGVNAIGVPPAQALLLSLVGYGGSLFWSVIGGLVYATTKQREHLEEIAQGEAAD